MILSLVALHAACADPTRNNFPSVGARSKPTKITWSTVCGEPSTTYQHDTLGWHMQASPDGVSAFFGFAKSLPQSVVDALPEAQEGTQGWEVISNQEYLVGIDRGEFGGGLWSVKNGKPVLISDAATVGPTKTQNGDFYVVFNNDLRTDNTGTISRVFREQENSQWRVESPIAQVPYTHLIKSSLTTGQLIIVTTAGIARLDESNRVQQILPVDFKGNGPISVAEFGKTIIVGLKYGILLVEECASGASVRLISAPDEAEFVRAQWRNGECRLYPQTHTSVTCRSAGKFGAIKTRNLMNP